MAYGGRGPQLDAILLTCLILSIVTGILRCYSMGVLLKRFYVEDWLAVISIIINCVYTAAGMISVHYGVGQHVVDVPPESQVHAVLWRWIASLIYIVISTLTKYVVGLFLLRICSHQMWQRITIYAILGLVTIFNVLYFFFDVFSCHPVEYEWLRYADPPAAGTCNSTSMATVTTYVAAFLNVVADWTLAILPSYLVWQAKMERRKKISVSAVLALGSIASIATIVRIPYAHGILDNPDFLYDFTDLGIWSTLEIGIALTASSLATLSPLFRKIRFFTSSSRNGSASRTIPGPWTSYRPNTQSRAPVTVVTEITVANQADARFNSDVELQGIERLSSSESNSHLKGGFDFRRD